MGGEIVQGVDFSQTPRMNVDSSHQKPEEPGEESKEQNQAAQQRNTDVSIDGVILRAIWPYLRPTEPIPQASRLATDYSLITELYDELLAKKKLTDKRLEKLLAENPDCPN